MPDTSDEKRVVVHADPSTLADAVAGRFIQRLIRGAGAGGPIHVSLTGGSMGGAVLAAVRTHRRLSEVDWADVHFWWSDERFVEADSPERNDVLARTALLDHLDIPAANIHPMGASDGRLDLDAATDAYSRELAAFGSAQEPWPSFDVCFLGVGPDGHIASLFPDRGEILVTDRVTLAVRDSPKPPPERITLTRPVINGSKRVWLVLAGADKASALGLALAGASYPSVPAAGAKGRRRTVFFVDEAAASQVPPELIDPEY
ncbi:6-phosphogluconolactonase [Microbacterium rhizosphaerae]|uniref:6-phosphogluconolactonase n=1 Tax=Microbacterium rhizosphaerae TaxID=1678237 RepID=A0ABZ0SJ18_9MICO|nr:6-phosphogluconolactonase [Microbacterium rhizosphaerae]WPR88161.1 6-phosphogluconolactonase [Microbacterium rhizosphaerae]